jgi:hypothetical protein
MPLDRIPLYQLRVTRLYLVLSLIYYERLTGLPPHNSSKFWDWWKLLAALYITGLEVKQKSHKINLGSLTGLLGLSM